jgi:hypothetical protein
VLRVQIRSYGATHDEVAEIRAISDTQADELRRATLRALKWGRARDFDYDPVHGIEQT